MRLKQHYECDAIENPVIEIENYRNEKKNQHSREQETFVL